MNAKQITMICLVGNLNYAKRGDSSTNRICNWLRYLMSVTLRRNVDNV